MASIVKILRELKLGLPPAVATRLELQEALAFLAPRMRDLRLDGEPQFESITGIYGLASLPIEFSV